MKSSDDFTELKNSFEERQYLGELRGFNWDANRGRGISLEYAEKLGE